MKSKKHLLKGAAIATLLASSVPGLSASPSKDKITTMTHQHRHPATIASIPNTLSRSVAANTKTIESLIDMGLQSVEQLLEISPRKRKELQPLYHQLKVLKDDVVNTIPMLLQQQQEVRQRYLTKVQHILKKLRSLQRHVRNKRTLQFLLNTIVALCFATVMAAPTVVMSNKESSRRRRSSYRFYQALDRQYQSGIDQQIVLLNNTPYSIPTKFRCPLTNKLKVVPVRIGDQEETYNAESLLTWIQENLPYYTKKDLISTLTIDDKLQHEIDEYLQKRMTYRKKVLPEYMQTVPSYYPGINMDEYMQALQKFEAGKTYHKNGDISLYKKKLAQIEQKWKPTSQQKDAGKNTAIHGETRRIPT